MKNKDEKRFYVYLHRKPLCGTIFYVGLGSSKRAWQKDGRNKHWKSVSDKYGFDVEILQEGMCRGEACLLEEWIIAKLRHQGEKLCNITDGGDGGLGRKVPRRDRIHLSRVRGGMPVFCSSGESFDSASDAARRISETLGRICHPSAILACCKGITVSAYGFRWSYELDDQGGVSTRNEIRSVKVCCSNGMVFESAQSASIYVSKSTGRNADASSILKASKSVSKSAYGFRWALGDDCRLAKEKCGLKYTIVRSDGINYRGVKEAAEHIFSMGLCATVNSARSSVSAAISRKSGAAYGFSWKKVLTAKGEDGSPSL